MIAGRYSIAISKVRRRVHAVIPPLRAAPPARLRARRGSSRSGCTPLLSAGVRHLSATEFPNRAETECRNPCSSIFQSPFIGNLSPVQVAQDAAVLHDLHRFRLAIRREIDLLSHTPKYLHITLTRIPPDVVFPVAITLRCWTVGSIVIPVPLYTDLLPAAEIEYTARALLIVAPYMNARSSVQFCTMTFVNADAL